MTMNTLIGITLFVGMIIIVVLTLFLSCKKPVGSREAGNVEIIGTMLLMFFVLVFIPMMFALFGEWPE